MIRATTPTFVFEVPVDPTSASDIKVMFSQYGSLLVEKGIGDCVLDGTQQTISLILTQAETKLFAEGVAEIQVALKQNSLVLASQATRICVHKILDDTIFEETT